MIRAPMTIALTLCMLDAAAGTRVLRQVEQPYELDLSAVKMPDSPVGTMSFKPCETCRIEYRSVYSGTTYLVNGRQYAFKDFLPAVASISASAGRSSSPFVGLFVDIQSQQVTRITVRQTSK